MPKRLSSALKLLSSLIIVSLFGQSLYANSLTIFEVRKNVPLTSAEEVYRDFYVDGGFEAGVKAGMYIDVVRKIPVHDNAKNLSRGDLVLTIGQVRVVHVQKNMSVVREFQIETPATRPNADYENLMIGDELDLKTAVLPEPKKAKKQSEHKEEDKDRDHEKREPARVRVEGGENQILNFEVSLPKPASAPELVPVTSELTEVAPAVIK